MAQTEVSRWPTKKLGDLADIVMGQSPPGDTYNTDGRGLPFFQGKAEFRDQHPEVQKWCDAPLKIAEAEDILLSVRAPVGPTNIARERCCIGRGLAAIRPKTASLSPRFLRYFFTAFESQIAQQGAGSTFDAIGRPVIESLDLPFPPFSEQERIVRLLDEAEALRRSRAQADERTNAVLLSFFHEMFGDAQFTQVPLRDVTSLITSGVTPRGGEEVYVTEGPYFIRSQNVQMNRLALSAAACLPAAIHEQMRRTKVAEGDVLLNITGASIGRVTWVDALDREANVSQHVCLIRPKRDLLNPVFLSVFISLPATQHLILQVQAGASRQALNHQQVRGLEIPLPPIARQQAFAAGVEKIRGLETTQATCRKRLDDLFQSLLRRAFQGEL